MAKIRVADLELLFTANTTSVEKAEKQIVAIGKKVESKPVKLDADAKGALAGMDRVEDAAKRLVSQSTAIKLDADIERATKGLDRTKHRLEDLQVRALGGLDVTADVKRAEAQLARTQRTLDGLVKARSVIEVSADTSQAEGALDSLGGAAKKSGDDAGERFGKNMIAALVAIPIAGAVIGIGAAAAKGLIDSFNEGLQVEARTDRLAALTGLSDTEAARLAAGAGEAYANNFGSSIEANMDTARIAAQFQIIDAKATTRDTQAVVSGLAGIADVLGEDVRPVAQSVTQILANGLAKDSKKAFDILAAGARNGVNRSEDLLDTFTEYSPLFKALGLDGAEALGLVSQAMKAGARNSDQAADALKEFQIRATDGSKASSEAFATLGFSAEEMTAKIASGGVNAREGLSEVLTKLREMEPGAARTAAAVGLFGTKAEDLADSLFAMDLSTAVAELEGVEGAAKRMFDTLTSNDASKIEQAQRNIEVAANGIKGALAAAFSEPLGDFADWVSQNRGPVLQFFADMIDGAIDFAVSATEGFGSFVAGPLADVIEGMKHVTKFVNPFADTSDLEGFINGMRDFESTTDATVDGLEDIRDRFSGFADGQIALGYLNDASQRTIAALTEIGGATDGARLAVENWDASTITATEAGRQLNDQLAAAVGAYNAEIEAARTAGEQQSDLQGRYATTRDALIEQLTAMGATTEQAQALIDTLISTPKKVPVAWETNTGAETEKVRNFDSALGSVRSPRVSVNADTTGAQSSINGFVNRQRTAYVDVVTRTTRSGGGRFADGGAIHGPGGPREDLVPILASNGEHMLTAREVQAAGGHGAILRMRKALASGRLKFADGGPIGMDRGAGSAASTSAAPVVVGGSDPRVVALLERIASNLGRPNVTLNGDVQRDWLDVIREQRNDEGMGGLG